MENGKFKKTILHIILASFWAFGTVSSPAQILLPPNFQEAALIAPPIIHPNNTMEQNLENTLVNIKAVASPILGINNGKLIVGSVENYGQGIIIDSGGIIVTNQHIIAHAQHIYVLLSEGKVYEATVLHQSPTDLCFIKINAPFPFKAISWANPSETAIGKSVIAMANPVFNAQRIHSGQVVNIFKGDASNKIELLEMNIPLAPGDSGGPILTHDGSLLGLIMAQKISDPSKTYAIAATRIQEEYIKYKESLLKI